MSKLKFLILFFVWNVNSQELIGFVYNNNIPISNVDVYVKGTSVKTQSNDNGKFILKVKKGDVVIFSHINMYPEKIIVRNFKNFKINLKSKTNVLNEVNIKAKKKKFKKNTKLKPIQSKFEKVKKRGSAYATHSFFSEDIKNFTVELPQALVGRVPNYTLTKKGVILRGRSFKIAYALWDIDGVIFERLPPYINPEYVESVHVITNPASSFYKYGKRARGGVIIVNTIKHSKINKKLYPQLDFLRIKDFEMPSKNEFLKTVKLPRNNIDSLRLMAFMYQNKGNFELALNINRLILAKTPNNIKSYRNLSEVLLKMNKKEEAWNIYKVFLKRKGKNIDNTSFNIIYHDMERLFHSYNVKEIVGNKFESQKQSSKIYENETRIVFEWTVPNQNVSIEVINPKNQSVNFQLGDKSVKDCFIEEFFIDETLKGHWVLNLSKPKENKLNGFLKITIYRNWISSNKILPEVTFFALSKATKTKYKLFNLKI